MIVYFPVASLFARLFRHRPFEAEIDDVYKRPSVPMNVGWIWPPKYTPQRPVSVGFLHEALKAEHAAYRRFYGAQDEQLHGHTELFDPVIGSLNLVQWLRVQAYHDAHHYERVRVRIIDPHYAGRTGRRVTTEARAGDAQALSKWRAVSARAWLWHRHLVLSGAPGWINRHRQSRWKP